MFSWWEIKRETCQNAFLRKKTIHGNHTHKNRLWFSRNTGFIRKKMVCCFEATLGDKMFGENIKPISAQCCYYVETILLSCSAIILLNQSCYCDIIQCSYYLETNQWTGFFVMEALGWNMLRHYKKQIFCE